MKSGKQVTLVGTRSPIKRVGEPWRRIRIAPPGKAAEEQKFAERRSIQFKVNHAMTIHRVFLGVTFLATRAWLRPVSRGNRHFTVGGGRLRQSGPRPETISLRSACTIRLKDFIANGFSSKSWPEQVRRTAAAAACTGGGVHLQSIAQRSPILQEVNSFALEPVAPTDDQEELLYSVEVPHSPSPVVQVPESPSYFFVSPVHFDSADINLDNTAKAQSSLPAASVDLSSLLDALQASLCQRMDDANNEFLSRLHSTERSLKTSLGHQNDYLRRLIEGARQEGQTQDDIQLLRLNELRKSVMAHDVKADTDSLDVRNKFIALDAKFRSLDGQIATIRNDQLEFQTKIAADILGLSTQISEIADYIRSGDGKKGEVGSSSRRSLPASQPSSNVQGSAVRTQTFPPTTGTFAERVEQARRHIIESGQVIST
ncbi:hypothetical protein F511_27337 [Dorcoceras hygrometricum]|uniref:Uncharacterized protein n=1 Tax=Dorcoceras hygrometricum TaxID=472368 RepID=A0A2Z7AS12_9LAMI|nr:hypothetical protein F511_27337 [Dorcoceras hygrometricum]